MNDPATRSFQTPHGPMLALRGDKFITRCLEASGEFSPGEWRLLEQLTRPGMTAVELGANIGVHTVPLARRCFPGTLYAFEPQQRIFQILCANLVLNDLGNVVALPFAAGEAEGVARIPDLDYAGTANFGGVSVQVGPGPAGRPVRVTALDDLDLAECGLLKIDVEGFERFALRGAASTIARCRPRIYIENDRREHQQEVISILDGMGYRLYWHLPPILEDAEESRRLFGDRIVSVNMLCIPKESPTVVEQFQMIDPGNWRHPLDRAKA